MSRIGNWLGLTHPVSKIQAVMTVVFIAFVIFAFFTFSVQLKLIEASLHPRPITIDAKDLPVPVGYTLYQSAEPVLGHFKTQKECDAAKKKSDADTTHIHYCSTDYAVMNGPPLPPWSPVGGAGIIEQPPAKK